MGSHKLSCFQRLSDERKKVAELVSIQQRLEREKSMAETAFKKKENEANANMKQLQDLYVGVLSENKKLQLKIDASTKEITELKGKYSSATASVK